MRNAEGLGRGLTKTEPANYMWLSLYLVAIFLKRTYIRLLRLLLCSFGVAPSFPEGSQTRAGPLSFVSEPFGLCLKQ